jgi:hypothetical protein
MLQQTTNLLNNKESLVYTGTSCQEVKLGSKILPQLVNKWPTCRALNFFVELVGSH